MKKKTFLNFPISLIPPIYEDADVYHAINTIIDYGIMVFINQNSVSLEEAGKCLGIKIGSSIDNLTKIYNKYHDSSRVMTSIDKKRAFLLRDSHMSYSKNKDAIITLCGELAIRSIIGKKEYAKCTKNFVLSRMAGFARCMEEDYYPEAVKRLAGAGGKRQWNKLKESLRYAGFSFYSPRGCHGFYVSFRLYPIELAEKVEKRRLEQANGWKYESNEDLRKKALEAISYRTPK